MTTLIAENQESAQATASVEKPEAPKKAPRCGTFAPTQAELKDETGGPGVVGLAFSHKHSGQMAMSTIGAAALMLGLLAAPPTFAQTGKTAASQSRELWSIIKTQLTA